MISRNFCRVKLLLTFFLQCTLPFDLVPRKRTRTYSFSGSERSHTATPTPSEAETTGEEESQMSQQETVPEKIEQPTVHTQIGKTIFTKKKREIN